MGFPQKWYGPSEPWAEADPNPNPNPNPDPNPKQVRPERAVGGGGQARGGRSLRAAGRGRRAVGQGAHRKGRRARGELKKLDIWMEARGGQRQTQSSVVFYIHTRPLVSTHNKHIP